MATTSSAGTASASSAPSAHADHVAGGSESSDIALAAPPPIKLADLDASGAFDRWELRAELRQRIGDAALVAAISDEALVRLAMPHFEPDAPNDVDRFCDAVLVRLEPVSEYPPSIPLVRGFVHHVLGFSAPPAEKRSGLFHDGLRHLTQLEELISFYEGLPAIAALRIGQGPRNHEAKMHVDFYERCLAERAAISRYLTNGADAEALRRSDEDYELRSAFSSFLSSFAEVPPYRLRFPRADEHLDFRKINRWRHRVRPLPITVGRELGAQYESGDLQGFYSGLQRLRSTTALFAVIESAVSTVPKLAARRETFAELRELHAAGCWRGFYALAMPQVEGLFAEMGDIASPGRTSPHAALPAKVRFIRAYAEVHEQSLDYFEYLLPTERNRFSHSGRIEDPPIRALELLYDLAFVCELYTEITSPVIELLKILKRDDLGTKLDIRQWAGIFELVGKVKQSKQIHEIDQPLRFFMSEHLPDTEMSRAANELAEALQKAAAYTRKQMLVAARNRLGVEFDLGSKKKSAEVVSKAAHILDLIDEFEALDRGLLLPLVLRTVMQGMQEHLELPQEARSRLSESLAAEATALANLDNIIKLGNMGGSA